MNKEIWTPDVANYYKDYESFDDLCNTIRDDILLADAIFLPMSHPMTPNQRVAMVEMASSMFIFLQAVRGGAKSWLTARFMLVWALTHSIGNTLTAPTFRQALSVFNYMHEFLKENSTSSNPIPLLNEVDGNILTGGNLEARFRLKNGSVTKALPMGSGMKIRGERADVLHCDEFFQMDKEMFQTHLLPFLAKPQIEAQPGSLKPVRTPPKLILTTSAEYENCFAYHFLINRMLPAIKKEDEIVASDPTYKRKYVVIDWNIDDLNASGYKLTPEIIDLMTGDTTPEEKERALYNKWVGISGQFFPANMVEKLESPIVHIEHEAEAGFDYALTVDVATVKGGDDFIIQVWKFLHTRKVALVNSYWNSGLSQSEMAWMIHQFNESFNPDIIFMDKGGGGYYVASELSKRELLLPDGTRHEVKNPILAHDQTGMGGQRKLVLNIPSDEMVRSAFGGNAATTGLISTEDVFLHLLYDGIRQELSGDPSFLIPMTASAEGDKYDRSEVQILDNIRESVYQLRHLTTKMADSVDGLKTVVLTKIGKVPTYVWKHAKKDGAVAFCYGYVPFLLHFKSKRGVEPGTPSIIIEQNWGPLGGLAGMYENPADVFNPFAPK